MIFSPRALSHVLQSKRFQSLEVLQIRFLACSLDSFDFWSDLPACQKQFGSFRWLLPQIPDQLGALFGNNRGLGNCEHGLARKAFEQTGLNADAVWHVVLKWLEIWNFWDPCFGALFRTPLSHQLPRDGDLFFGTPQKSLTLYGIGFFLLVWTLSYLFVGSHPF